MVIFNKKLSVSPITTHEPLKYVSIKITTRKIIEKVKVINDFWKKNFNQKPKIAITGLNPHCESIDKHNEDKKITLPAVKRAINIHLKLMLMALLQLIPFLLNQIEKIRYNYRYVSRSSFNTY